MTRFRVSAEPLDLVLKRTFTISRWSRDVAPNVLVRVEADGIEGIGEAAPNARYRESQDSALAWIRRLDLAHVRNPFDMEAFQSYLDAAGPGEYAARVAVEMALYDWIGKRLGVPLHQIWNAPSARGPVTTYTIGLDSLENLKSRIDEAAGFPILKVKLGTADDEAIIRHLRTLTDKPIWVDANEGWTDVATAASRIRFLADQGVEMVEQPMPAAMTRELAELRRTSPLPVYADESFTGTEDPADLARCFHGINIKIMKTGSLRRSLQWVFKARKAGLGVMVGCMIESSLADTASALIALWADAADLDGHVLIRDDPFRGLVLDADKRVHLNDLPGLGVIPS
jgi:L-alanine-DL-glutamate epimerase-like enolase superfamily enzyme